ncbi:hypothetical protein [Chromobacterium haemolyticum]|uniref:hypothetical protein n=1 Tax=Chromobacterium haemolyticum TaxID=394935 RepID=UPI00113119CE|nr:hypothetical protein [Chromobacterium haemolyticum]
MARRRPRCWRIGPAPPPSKPRSGCFSRSTPPRAPSALLKSWNQTLAALAPLLSPDPGVAPDPSPYELTGFRDQDLARIPPSDLPFGMPAWLGQGDMATRVIKGQAKLKAPAANASILWTAQADLG